MKQIQVNVNLFFSVPDDYVVTDTEWIEFKGVVELHGADDTVLAKKVTYHETIEVIDMGDLGEGF